MRAPAGASHRGSLVKNLVAKREVVGVRGTDSFHAVWLVCALALKLLGNLKADGWQLLNPDESEFPLEAYLSGLGEKAE